MRDEARRLKCADAGARGGALMKVRRRGVGTHKRRADDNGTHTDRHTKSVLLICRSAGSLHCGDQQQPTSLLFLWKTDEPSKIGQTAQ